jgi:hypothetical protein
MSGLEEDGLWLGVLGDQDREKPWRDRGLDLRAGGC